MSSPTSPAIGLVSAKIKLFNSKSENDSSITTTDNTPLNNTLPPLPPKPVKITTLSTSNSTSYRSAVHAAAPPPPPPPPPPPTSSNPPPLPLTPPRPVNRPQVAKGQYKKPQASPIVAQKSGSSTLKVMLGKVVGSVSGMLLFINPTLLA